MVCDQRHFIAVFKAAGAADVFPIDPLFFFLGAPGITAGRRSRRTGVSWTESEAAADDEDDDDDDDDS